MSSGESKGLESKEPVIFKTKDSIFKIYLKKVIQLSSNLKSEDEWISVAHSRKKVSLNHLSIFALSVN